MKNNLLSITDFCRECDKLATLTYQSNKSQNCKVTWSICDEKSFLRKYDGKLFMIDIDAAKKKKREQKEERKAKEADFDNLILSEDFIRNFEWQIWNLTIDFDENLQWLSCSKTFWFSWLIDWITNNPSWPNWRWEMKKSNIITNKEIKKQAKYFDKNNDKLKYPKCSEHNKNWELYWKNCYKFIWIKWIMINKHNDHVLIESKELMKKIKDVTINNPSYTTKILNKRIDKDWYLRISTEVNQIIFKRAIKHMKSAIDTFEKQLNENITNVDNNRANLFWIDGDKYLEGKKLINKFKESKDLNLLDEVWASLMELKDFEEKTIQSEKIVDDLMKKCDMKNFGEFIRYYFDVQVSELVSDKDIWIQIKEMPNLSIHFKKEMENSNRTIFASLDHESKYKIVWQLGDISNWVTKVTDSLTTLLIQENKLFKIGKLKLKWDIKNSINRKLKFYLILKLIDENIWDQIKNTEILLIERISQDIKNKVNYQYERSSDEDDVENKKKSNTKSEKKSN